MGYRLCEKVFGGGLSRSQDKNAGQALWEKSLDKKVYGGKMGFVHWLLKWLLWLLKTLRE